MQDNAMVNDAQSTKERSVDKQRANTESYKLLRCAYGDQGCLLCGYERDQERETARSEETRARRQADLCVCESSRVDIHCSRGQ